MAMPEMRAKATRSGFTLIELLIVVVIIAILAGVAFTRFGGSKRRAYIAAMKTDLHNLEMLAETQFAAENSYAGVEVPAGSEGVILTFVPGDGQWQATAVHEALPGFACTIRSGGGTDAEPICR